MSQAQEILISKEKVFLYVGAPSTTAKYNTIESRH